MSKSPVAILPQEEGTPRLAVISSQRVACVIHQVERPVSPLMIIQTMMRWPVRPLKATRYVPLHT